LATVPGSVIWDIDALVDPDPTLSGGETWTLTYQMTAPNSVSGSYTNDARVTGEDTLGNTIPADNNEHFADNRDTFVDPDGTPNNGDEIDQAEVTLTAAAAIQGFVWNDIDADGVYEPAEGETPFSTGFTLQLYLDADGDGTPDGAPIATTS